ncbi:MEDS domain-containing protein [bacterium]|nr:MEDS domain-containing protein [bacterium]
MCNYKKRKVSLGFTDEEYDLPLHMCYIYQDDDERMETIGKFIKSGLEAGDKVYYFVDTLSIDEMKEKLLESGVSKEAFEQEHIRLRHSKSVYYPEGSFDVDSVLGTVKQVYSEELGNGYNVRNTGEMSWALRDVPGSEHLIEYEAKINILANDTPINGICQYDARKFTGATIMDVLAVHPYSIISGQVIKNPFYTPPEEFLEKYLSKQAR